MNEKYISVSSVCLCVYCVYRARARETTVNEKKRTTTTKKNNKTKCEENPHHFHCIIDANNQVKPSGSFQIAPFFIRLLTRSFIFSSYWRIDGFGFRFLCIWFEVLSSSLSTTTAVRRCSVFFFFRWIVNYILSGK